jgi:hypothetical protein
MCLKPGQVLFVSVTGFGFVDVKPSGSATTMALNGLLHRQLFVTVAGFKRLCT